MAVPLVPKAGQVLGADLGDERPENVGGQRERGDYRDEADGQDRGGQVDDAEVLRHRAPLETAKRPRLVNQGLDGGWWTVEGTAKRPRRMPGPTKRHDCPGERRPHQGILMVLSTLCWVVLALTPMEGSVAAPLPSASLSAVG